MTLRTAHLENAAALLALHRRASYFWEEDREQLDAHPDVFGVDEDALASGDVRAAEGEDGRIIGFATVRRGTDRHCVLEDLFVEPDEMRTGIGRTLVEDAADRAAAAGCGVMWVTGASRTRGFYERVGFRLTGPAVTQFGPALRFRRTLAG